MFDRKPDHFVLSTWLSIGELKTLCGNPNAVFSYQFGRGAKIYFVQVPSISSLHNLMPQ